MIGDLKTAHLLRSSPKAVFGGQLCGAIVSVFMAAGVYVVFSTAYPCINDLAYATCSFPTPDVQSWRVRPFVFFIRSFILLLLFIFPISISPRATLSSQAVIGHISDAETSLK